MGGTAYEAILSGLQAGDEVDYYLFAMDQSGRRECHPYIGAADPHHFKVLTVGVEDVATSNTIAVYPNPCSRYFVVNCPKTVQSIEVFDIAGSLVYSARGCDDKTIINTSDWKSGVYLVRILDKAGNLCNRKVVKR